MYMLFLGIGIVFMITVTIGIAIHMKNPPALIQQSTKQFHALYTKVAESISLGLILAQLKLGALGQQLLTIAHKIHQRVLVLLRQGN